MTKSALEMSFAEQLAQSKFHELCHFEREYRFAAIAVGLGDGVRARLREAGLQDWRFDFAYPDLRIAIEIDGGTYSGGRHTRGKGYESDARKLNSAALLGWRVLRFTGEHVYGGYALRTVERLFGCVEDKRYD